LSRDPKFFLYSGSRYKSLNIRKCLVVVGEVCCDMFGVYCDSHYVTNQVNA